MTDLLKESRRQVFMYGQVPSLLLLGNRASDRTDRGVLAACQSWVLGVNVWVCGNLL